MCQLPKQPFLLTFINKMLQNSLPKVNDINDVLLYYVINNDL